MTRFGKISFTDCDSIAVSVNNDSTVVVVVGVWNGVNSIKQFLQTKKK